MTRRTPNCRHLLTFLLAAALGLAACDDDGGTVEADTSPGDTASTSDADATEPGDTASDTSPPGDTRDTTVADTGDTTTQDTADTADTSDTADAITPPPEGCRPVPFDVGVTYTKRVVVAPGGDDFNGDGSDAAPYGTLARAAQDATPGTKIVVQAGTYNFAAGYFDSLQGTADAPIAIVAEGGEVIFDAQGAGEVMHLSEARYVVLEGLTLQNSTANGLNIDDGGSYDTPAEHVVLRDLTLRDIGAGSNNDCIKLSGVDRFFVLDSNISGCNAGDGIDMVGCHQGTIAGNVIHDTPGGGIQAKGGTADILMTGNRFVDVIGRSINAGGSTGLEFFRPIDAPHEAARLEMIGNVFVRPGAESGAAVAYVGCDACIFAHNTLIDPQTWVARILQETVDPERFVPSRDGLFVNNIVVFDLADLRNGTFVNVGADTAPETFTFAYNLWFSTDTSDFAGPTYSGGIPPEAFSIIQQDPLLDADHRTLPGSPAAGAGMHLPGSPRADYDGDCYAQPPTIGAFEVQ